MLYAGKAMLYADKAMLYAAKAALYSPEGALYSKKAASCGMKKWGGGQFLADFLARAQDFDYFCGQKQKTTT